MSKEEYDDKRQYQCLRKYDKIVNQFDELIQIVEARTKPPKRRRVSSSPRRSKSSSSGAGGSNSASTTPGGPGEENTTSNTTTTTANIRGSNIPSENQADINGVLVQIITRHLNDLKTDHDQL